MNKPTVMDMQIKAEYLGFVVQVMGKMKYRVRLKGAGIGYQGGVVECMAYLQGWDESRNVLAREAYPYGKS